MYIKKFFRSRSHGKDKVEAEAGEIPHEIYVDGL